MKKLLRSLMVIAISTSLIAYADNETISIKQVKVSEEVITGDTVAEPNAEQDNAVSESVVEQQFTLYNELIVTPVVSDVYVFGKFTPGYKLTSECALDENCDAAKTIYKWYTGTSTSGMTIIKDAIQST